MKKMYVLFAVLLMFSILAACSGEDEDKSEEKEEQPTSVKTSEAAEGNLVVNRNVFGRTAPSSTTPVMLSQPGEIDDLEVKNGDTVEEDDTLAKLVTRAGQQTIKAGASGTITNLDTEEGGMASADEPFAVIADTDKLTVEFAVTTAVRDLFKKDETYDLTVDDNTYEADVLEKSLMPNDQGLYTVKASVENKDGKLLPGMVVKLSVPQKRVKDTVLIPTSAIVEESEGAFVFIVKDNKVSKTGVKLDDTQSDEAAVKEGVKKGDIVVISGQNSLADQDEIKVVKEGESS